MIKTSAFLLGGGGFLAGLFLGNWWQVSLTTLLIGLLIATVLLLVTWRVRLVKRALIGSLFCILGLAYFTLWSANLQKDIRFGESTKFHAEVVSCLPTFRSFRCVIDAQKPYSARLATMLDEDIRPGTQVDVAGTVTALSSRDSYLRGDGVVAWLKDAKSLAKQERPHAWRALLDRFKTRCERILSQALTEPSSSLGLGFLFGSRQNFTDDFLDALKRTNTMHIIAVSGFNITLVAGFVRYLLRPFSRKTVFVGSSALVIFFVGMIGAPASAVRAGIMGVFLFLERVIGRKAYTPSLIILTALLMALPNPAILRYDLGFQLSFLAFIGLVGLSPIIERRLNWLAAPIRSIAAPTLGATLATMPLLIPLSGEVSLVGPLANLLVLPLVPLVMLLSAVVLAIGALSLPVAKLGGAVLYLPSLFIVATIETAGSFSFATIPWVWGVFLTLAVALLALFFRRRHVAS